MSKLTQQQWHHIIQEQQNSGISIKAYCREHNLHPATFHYHKKRILPSSQEKVFLPVKVQEETAIVDTVSIRINHTVLEIPTTLLPSIIKVLL